MMNEVVSDKEKTLNGGPQSEPPPASAVALPSKQDQAPSPALAWPVLDPAAYHGVVGQFVKAINRIRRLIRWGCSSTPSKDSAVSLVEVRTSWSNISPTILA